MRWLTSVALNSRQRHKPTGLSQNWGAYGLSPRWDRRERVWPITVKWRCVVSGHQSPDIAHRAKLGQPQYWPSCLHGVQYRAKRPSCAKLIPNLHKLADQMGYEDLAETDADADSNLRAVQR
jgi:hypothetical protein